MASDQVSALAEMVKRIRLETFIADCGARLAAAVPAGRIEEHVEDALRRLIEIIDVDRCILVGAAPANPIAWVTCAVCGPGVPPLPESTNFAKTFPWLIGAVLREHRAVGFRSIAELPPGAERDRESAGRMGIRAMLLVPLTSNDAGARLLMMQSLRDGPEWPEYCGERLRVLGGMLVGLFDRRRAEETFQELEREAADWLAAVHAILWRADPHTYQTTFVSKEAESMLGYPLDSWVKVPGFWLEHIHPEDREWVRSFVSMAVHDSRKYDFEYRMVTADGRTLWLRNIVNVRVEDGRPAELVGVTVDISKRKRAEFETARLRHELAHALRVTSLGELAATLAHELNQPLGAIVSNAESAQVFLRRQPPALDQLETILVDIAHDSERAAAVLTRVRNLLQNEPGELQPLRVDTLVREAVDSMRALAHSRRIDLSVDLDPDLPVSVGDAVQIQQVILNLVTNAMDAVAERPEGRRSVNIRATRNSGGIELSVADSGVGIEPGMRSRIFEPFFTTKAGGMGMGLTICRTIVHGHGGHIRVGDNPGGGAVLTVMLPIGGGAQEGA